jgi:uncharacterized membrane protein
MTSLNSLVQNLSAQTRLGWSMTLAIGVFVCLPPAFPLSTRLLAAWCVGVGFFLALVLMMMRVATAEVTRYRSQRFGARPFTLFVLPVISACISVLAIAFLLSATQGKSTLDLTVHIGLSALAIIISWSLLHVTFARRYATLYYQPNGIYAEDAVAGGLKFVEETTPTYLDFLYFAFILGCTAQTADTMILSRPMRRLALAQCLIAFFYFVGVLGMTVNLGSGILATTHP